MKQTYERYSVVARLLHWLIALLIISEYLIGLSLENFPLKWLHIDIGVLILTLVIFRIVWRLTHKYPPLDPNIGKLNQVVAHIGHLALYGFMLTIPVLGLIVVLGKGVDFNLFGVTIPPLIPKMDYDLRHRLKEIHEYLAHGIIIFASLHALAALLHQFVHKHHVLVRMLPEKIANIIENK